MIDRVLELLRDRRCAGNDPTMAQTGKNRTNARKPIDPVMAIEAFVLRREDGVDDMTRDVLESEFAAESLRHARFAQRNAGAVQQRDALQRRTQQRRRNWNQLQSEMARD